MINEDYLKFIEVLWPVFVAIVVFYVRQVIPYFQTKIFKYKHYNLEMSFWLAEYEMLGALVTQILVMFFIIVCGKSTWNNLILKEYIIVLCIITILYLLGIFLIIKWKKEKGGSKYLRNVFLGLFINGLLSFQFVIITFFEYEQSVNKYIYFFVVGMLLIQILVNHEDERLNTIEYKIYVGDEVLCTKREPIKRGNYFFIKLEDKDGRKMVQIPEDRITKIEYEVSSVKRDS